MKGLIRKLSGRNLYPVLPLVWVLLCALPWAPWLESWPWIRLCISLFILITPGFALSLLLVNKRLTLLAHLTSGLAISVFIFGSLGLLGRTIHLPFTFIKATFMLLGLVCVLLLTRYSFSGTQLYNPKKFSITTIAILLFTMIVGSAKTLKYGLKLDDFSYLAYLTTWQYSQTLDFKDVFFGLGDMGQIRFWLAMFPMDQALLSEISGLHGLLLIGYYFESWFIIFAILAAYNLYEDFLPEKEYAAVALLLHFALLIVPEPGGVFLNNLSQDKAFAAFILAPIFFLSGRCFFDTFTLRGGIFFLLIGFSLTLTHPIMLAYSVFIIALYAIIVMLMTKEYKKLGIILALLAVVIFPVGLLRFVSVPWISRYLLGSDSVLQQPGAFDFESASDTRNVQDLISNIEGTRFYGFNPERIQILANRIAWTGWWVFISWGYIYILILGLVWSLFNLRRNSVAPFIFATSLLVLFALIPYTGWLMGYFVSARMLWRTSWLYPIGLTTAVLSIESLKLIARWMSGSRMAKFPIEPSGLILISVLCLNLIRIYSGLEISGKLSIYPDRESYLTRLTGLAALGDYLETNIEAPSTFLAPQEIMYYLPGLSSKAKVVFFREERYNLRPIDEQQLELIFSRKNQASMEQRMEILEQYKVQYILVNEDPLRAFYAKDPHFKNIKNIGNFSIFEFVDATP